MASDPSAMLEQSPAAIYCALDDARSDILTLCREVQRLSAALAAQPAADHLGGPCLTCGDKGAVGNILNAEPCPDCTPSAPLQPAQSAWPRPVADDAMERALTELVEKIVPGLDTGDLLADARTASKALDRAQPAASAEPEQYKTDDELGGVLAAIRHYGGQKWMEGRGVADDDLKNVREAWDAVYERVQALARYGKAGDAFWSRNGLRATLAAQPAASAEPTEQDLLILFGMWGWQTADGREFRFEHFKEMARHLVGRYGAPVAAQAPAAAGDEQPVAWVAADTLNSPHPTCISSLAYMSQIDQERGREYVPLYAAPVAAQEADDADPLQGAANLLVNALAKPRPTEIAARLLIGYNRAERLFDAAIAQQGKGED